MVNRNVSLPILMPLSAFVNRRARGFRRLPASTVERAPGRGIQDGEAKQAGAATAGDGGSLQPLRGYHELDGVGGVLVRPDVQEPDVTDPVTLAVADRAAGAQILQ